MYKMNSLFFLIGSSLFMTSALAEKIAQSSVARVIHGMEAQFEEAMLVEYNIIGNARNAEGNDFYFVYKDHSPPRFDNETGLNFTHYQMFEAWHDELALSAWVNGYMKSVIENPTVRSTLIGGKIVPQSLVGYNLFGDIVTTFEQSSAIVAGRAIGKVYIGKESEFENAITSKWNLLNVARNASGNVYYYLFKDRHSPHYDVQTGNNYTYYEFVEAWASMSAIYAWLGSYPPQVFGDSDVQQTLIGGALSFPSDKGYQLFGGTTYDLQAAQSSTTFTATFDIQVFLLLLFFAVYHNL